MKFPKYNSEWKSPLHITLIYLMVGVLWIVLSDTISNKIPKEWPMAHHIQTIKGIFYILSTAVLLFALIYRHMNKQLAFSKTIMEKNRFLHSLFENQKGTTVLVFDNNLNLLLHIGNDQCLGLKSININNKLNLANLQHKISWFEPLKQMIHSVKRDTHYSGELHIADHWYEVVGNFMESDNDTQMCLLLFTDKTESKELIELNQIYKDEHTALQKKISDFDLQYLAMAEKLAALLNAFPYPVTIHKTLNGAKGPLIEANNKAIGFFRLPIGQFSGFNIDAKLLYADEAPLLYSKTEYGHVQPIKQRNALFSKDGAEFQLKVITQNVEWDKEEFVVCHYIDCTSENHEIANLQNSLLKTHNILNHIGFNLMAIDHDLKCIFINNSMAKLLGTDISDNPSKPFDVLNTKTSLFHLGEIIDQTLTQKTPRSVELQFISNPSAWYKLTLIPFINTNNQAETLTLLLEDVTLLKEQEQKFINNILQAEESNRLKTIFLSNLSHEVRTPMNGILGFLDLLEMDALSDDQTRFVELIRKSTDKLLLILNSIMEISQIETNQVELDSDWVNVDKLSDQIKEMTQRTLFRSGKTHLNLSFKMDFQNANRIWIDFGCFIKIIDQIFDNAVKFTLQGSIEVGIKCSDSTLNLWVRDTGVGIKQTLSDAIFLPFTSFNNGEGVVFDGIGLGLTIVKGLVELQNGHIDMESQPNVGTTFYVELPIKLIDPVVAPAAPNQLDNANNPVPLEQLPIKVTKTLLIEDSFENSQLMRALLEQFGVEVLYAYDGITAIEMFYESQTVDLVFCDIRLPDIDGFEVLTAIRRINPNIPVIANTAYVMNEDRKKCLDAGFNDYLPKPIMREDLLKILVNPPRTIKK